MTEKSSAVCRREVKDLQSYFSLQTRIVNHLVDVIGRDARLDLTRRYVEHLPRHVAYLTHCVLLLLVQDRNLVPPHKHLFRPWDAIARVVGMPYPFRNGSSR